MDSRGPLTGLRIIEMEGIGPPPFAAMLLADMGAEVIRITRPDPSGLGIERPPEFELPARGRRSVAMDLKNPEAVACLLDLIARADGLIEGFRPGVMERLGLGPKPCLHRNPRLVYGRMTGWGQTGPLAPRAGHDVNYLALTGLLDMIGREGQPPTIPLNLLADYAGGSLMLVIGMLAALLHAKSTGQGQVIDAAMVDGGLPEYSVYECADGRYLSVGALEPKFRRILLEGLGLDEAAAPLDGSPESRIKARAAIAGRIKQRDRDEWVARFEGLDACVAPVLSQDEAALHPHNAARENHVEIAGIVQPAPAPRFSVTHLPTPTPPEPPGASGKALLAAWGLSAERIEALLRSGAVIAGDEGEGGS